jgi:hypothetical protein
MDRPLVSVIVVTWNGRELLREFMPSVMALDYPNYEVVVVDNASQDGSAEFLETTYPRVRLVRNPRNDGTAEGSNVGARAAKGDFLFFISNDMWLDPAILTHLMAHMETEPQVGICTVKMRRITADGQRLMEIDSVGADIDVFGFPAARGIHEKDEGQWDAYAEVFFSFGGAMLIRRDLFEMAGQYDEAFFTLTDDIDLSWRVRLLGYRVMAEPKALLYHRVSATLDTPAFKRAFRRFISERNTLRTLLKNYSLVSLAWVLPLDLVLLLGEAAFFLVLGQPRIAWAGFRAVGWNLRRLPDTWRLRRKVQVSRTVGDLAILRRMRPGSEKLRVFKDFVAKHDTPLWRGYFGRGRPGAGEQKGTHT